MKFPDKKNLSVQLRDFILKLLHKKPELRLGNRHGIKEIFAHPWLGKIDKKKFLQYEVKVPFIPQFGLKAFDIECLPRF